MRIKIVTPKNCPSCDSELVHVNSQLFCRNRSCPSVFSKRIQHMVKALGIKDLGEKRLEKLGLNDLLDIFLLTKEDLIERLK